MTRTCAPLAACLLLTSCTGEVSGPPTLRPGRDQCAECGMSIDDARFAAALLVERDGRREYLCFDDAGCMVDARLKLAAGLHPLDAYVHDFGTGSWCPALSASYLANDSEVTRTPMASGIVAFQERAAADRAQKDSGGEVLTHDAMVAWRQARLDRRRR